MSPEEINILCGSYILYRKYVSKTPTSFVEPLRIPLHTEKGLTLMLFFYKFITEHGVAKIKAIEKPSHEPFLRMIDNLNRDFPFTTRIEIPRSCVDRIFGSTFKWQRNQIEAWPISK